MLGVTLADRFYMTKVYDILLDNKKIGTTELEKADAPMGIVFGRINLISTDSAYHFFKKYCQTKNIKIVTDYHVIGCGKKTRGELVTLRVKLKIPSIKQPVL